MSTTIPISTNYKRCRQCLSNDIPSFLSLLEVRRMSLSSFVYLPIEVKGHRIAYPRDDLDSDPPAA